MFFRKRPIRRGDRSILTAGLCALAVVIAGAGQALATQEKPPGRGGGGGGGGIGISIDIGRIIENATRPRDPGPPPRQPIARPACPAPLVRSRRSGRCVCPSSRGYVMRRGKCVRKPTQTASCKFPLVKSGKRCICARGYVRHGRGCRKPPKVVVTEVPRIQECLQKAGYDPGPTDGKPGGKTRRAWAAFQKQHGLKPASLTDKPTRNKLFEICDALSKGPQVAEATPAPTRGLTAPSPVQSTDTCLPQDLFDVVKAAYGRRPKLKACPNACLPRPVGYSDAEIAKLGATHNLNWCASCIRLGGFLPLADILRIEGLANITLCSSPPAQMCHLPTRTIVKTYPKIRTIFKKLPVSVGNEGDIAVIVGNEDYGDDLPANANGQRDTGAVRTLLTEQLGYDEKNIIDLRNATLADLQRVFGSAENPKGELASRYARSRRGDVFIYASSHGMTAEDTSHTFLLPVDGKIDDLDKTAYPLSVLYANLEKLGAPTIMVVLEANFARDLQELTDPPNLPEMEVAAMPVTAVPGLAVFKASDRDQKTLEDPEFGIGLFTRYLIEGLAGKADTEPLGNADGRIDAVELFVYTSNTVRMAARKSFGLEQKPLLSKIDNHVVGRLAQR
ncbi:MAG: peptidoglycan-binding protein [Hyphomicrobiales bacterium]|nr:peptidoglycan-binding protein [Hyphomicrobiales bacterium]